MNCQLQRLRVVAGIGVVLGLLLSTASAAWAQPVNERALVVDVKLGAVSEPHLVRELREHLRRSGITLTLSTLQEPERACNNPECLDDLAKREDAGFVVYAQVDESAASTFAITMAMFDAVRHTPVTETAECAQCNQDLLSYKLNDLADALIRRCRDLRLLSPIQGQNSNPPPVPVIIEKPVIDSSKAFPFGQNPPKTERGFFAQLSPTRKIIASVLGGLAGAALISSIALTVTNGHDTTLGCVQRTDVLQDKCILKNTPLFATGYALTGALAIGIGFTLFWPKSSSRSVHSGVR